jgi:hypothetical protein
MVSEQDQNTFSETTELQYEVDANRMKPDVNTSGAYTIIGAGVIYLLVSLVFCYLFMSGLIDEFTRANLISICGGLFAVLFFFAFGVGTIFLIKNGLSWYNETADWMRSATKSHATIIDIQENKVITQMDYRYGGYTMKYYLILQVNDQPAVQELDGRVIRVEVSKRIFDRYARKDRVVIYFDKSSPLTFILEGE